MSNRRRRRSGSRHAPGEFPGVLQRMNVLQAGESLGSVKVKSRDDRSNGKTPSAASEGGSNRRGRRKRGKNSATNSSSAAPDSPPLKVPQVRINPNQVRVASRPAQSPAVPESPVAVKVQKRPTPEPEPSTPEDNSSEEVVSMDSPVSLLRFSYSSPFSRRHPAPDCTVRHAEVKQFFSPVGRDFRVVGVLGRPSSGKSTIMNLLDTDVEGRFPLRPFFGFESPMTKGVEVLVTADRFVLLDTEPLNCTHTLFEKLLPLYRMSSTGARGRRRSSSARVRRRYRKPRSPRQDSLTPPPPDPFELPSVSDRAPPPDAWMGLANLRLASLLLAVTHTLIIVVDDVDAGNTVTSLASSWTLRFVKLALSLYRDLPDFFREKKASALQKAAQPRRRAVSVPSDADDSHFTLRKSVHLPDIVFVFTNASFPITQLAIDRTQAFLDEYFSLFRFRKNAAVHPLARAYLGNPVDGETHVNFFILPTRDVGVVAPKRPRRRTKMTPEQLRVKERQTQFEAAVLAKQRESWAVAAGILRDLLLSIPRNPVMEGDLLTEREWLLGCNRVWSILLNKASLPITEFESQRRKLLACLT